MNPEELIEALQGYFNDPTEVSPKESEALLTIQRKLISDMDRNEKELLSLMRRQTCIFM
jgi:hypothetical protein